MNFIDTNILLYSLEGERSLKGIAALSLLNQNDCVLSVQILSEFYVQATRPSRDKPLSHILATHLIKTWCRFKIIDNSLDILQKALEIKEKYGFSYWDSAVIAAALKAGCHILYSEDMQHGQKIGDLNLINPFIPQ